MSDMLFHSIFPARELKKEEQVVIEENISNSNSGDILSSDMMDAMLYGGSQFAEPVDTIAYHHPDRPFQRKTIMDVYRRHYQPCNMVISIVSHIPFSKIIAILGKSAFGSGPSTTSMLSSNRMFGIPLEKRDIQYAMDIMKSGYSTFIDIGFRTCNHSSKDKYILNLIKYVMSGSFSSRMFTVLREQHGLTYSSDASTHYCEIGGEFVFSAESDSKRVIRNGGVNSLGVLPLLIRIIRTLICDGIS
jgi:predicted Zn-dependent peptidase